MFWSDSEVALRYVRNKSQKMKIFATDRFQMFKDNSQKNPADYSAKGKRNKKNSVVKRRWLLMLLLPNGGETSGNCNRNEILKNWKKKKKKMAWKTKRTKSDAKTHWKLQPVG